MRCELDSDDIVYIEHRLERIDGLTCNDFIRSEIDSIRLLIRKKTEI